MNHRSRALFVSIATVCFLLSLSTIPIFADERVESEKNVCPENNAAFVKTCSGLDSPHDADESSVEEDTVDETTTGEQIEDEVGETTIDDHVEEEINVADEVTGNSKQDQIHTEGTSESHSYNSSIDESDLVSEVLQESSKQQPSFREYKLNRETGNEDEFEEAGDIGATAMKQFKHTFGVLTHKYYDPLPPKAKCAVGTICGFTASRLTLGVANRIVRLTGAVWVASEVLYTSGFCDEAQCVPGEMRPWIGILKRALINQCIKVRLLARKIYNQERIREIAQQDQMFAGGFASGALVGFVV
jgi:hypothetical protein